MKSKLEQYMNWFFIMLIRLCAIVTMVLAIKLSYAMMEATDYAFDMVLLSIVMGLGLVFVTTLFWLSAEEQGSE